MQWDQPGGKGHPSKKGALQGIPVFRLQDYGLMKLGVALPGFSTLPKLIKVCAS